MAGQRDLKTATRRTFLAKSGVALGAAALAPVLPESVLSRLGGGLWLPAAGAKNAGPSVVLNPADTSNFKIDGSQAITPGSVLTLTDQSVSDYVVLFALDNDAAAGTAVDVVATFQVQSTIPVNADVGNRIAINDGQTHAVVAACAIVGGVRGIGLLAQGNPADESAYPVFVPVDWQAAPVTVTLRRTRAGDAQLLAVNGTRMKKGSVLSASQLPGPTRTATTVEFGTYSAEAMCTVTYSAFSAQRVH
jgi:hypothetical protein